MDVVLKYKSYLPEGSSNVHKTFAASNTRNNNMTAGHNSRWSAYDSIKGIQPMAQSKHNHHGQSNSHRLREYR